MCAPYIVLDLALGGTKRRTHTNRRMRAQGVCAASSTGRCASFGSCGRHARMRCAEVVRYLRSEDSVLRLRTSRSRSAWEERCVVRARGCWQPDVHGRVCPVELRGKRSTSCSAARSSSASATSSEERGNTAGSSSRTARADAARCCGVANCTAAGGEVPPSRTSAKEAPKPTRASAIVPTTAREVQIGNKSHFQVLSVIYVIYKH